MKPQCAMTFVSNCRISGPGKVSSVQLSLLNCLTFAVIEHQCWAYANQLISMTDLIYSSRYLTELRCMSSIFHMETFFIWVWTNAIRLPTWVPSEDKAWACLFSTQSNGKRMMKIPRGVLAAFDYSLSLSFYLWSRTHRKHI